MFRFREVLNFDISEVIVCLYSGCFKWFEKKGLTVFVNIMQISELELKKIQNICKVLNKTKIKALYLADSLGSLLPKQTKKIFLKFKKYSTKERNF